MNRAKISPERWREIKPLLESALELKKDDRRAFLDEACAGDHSRRRDVDSFIAASEQAGDFMDKPAFEEAARKLADEQAARKNQSLDEVITGKRQYNATTLIDDQPNFTLAPGAILDGRYLIKRELEPGGIGQVFVARNLKNLELPAELVTLSACETGLGKLTKGEGLVSLTRGFMYAGAARVVVSLWSVSDRATAELMEKFYRRMLVRGYRPAAALRAAQIRMWKDRRWEAPYYWAAFTLQGEWR